MLPIHMERDVKVKYSAAKGGTEAQVLISGGELWGGDIAEHQIEVNEQSLTCAPLIQMVSIQSQEPVR